MMTVHLLTSLQTLLQVTFHFFPDTFLMYPCSIALLFSFFMQGMLVAILAEFLDF